MPEAVEVRKFADIISANILGHKITQINILKGRYKKKPFEGYNDLVKELPLTIDAINTKGKFTYITLSNTLSNTSRNENNKKTFYLFNTLGLSGGWTIKGKNKSDFANCGDKCNYMEQEIDSENSIFTYPNMMEYITEDMQNEWFQRALNHLNVEFITDKKTKTKTNTNTNTKTNTNTFVSFYFYDQLSFGTLKSIENGTENNGKQLLEKKLRELGPDLIDSSTTFDMIKDKIRKKVNESKAIGNVIVNQKIISGVGNYLRADALWMAKISPFRKVSEVTDKELEILYWSLLSLIWGDYNFKEGKKMGYIKYKIPDDYKRNFFVYRQDTDIHGNPVIKKELFEGSQKRFIYWVKEVQK
jgi:formamidopyrimidine-DNA glycosylase